MHLNDSQLLAPSDIEMSHILGCDECENKFDNRVNIQNKLNLVLAENSHKFEQVSWLKFNSELGKKNSNNVSYINMQSKKESREMKKRYLFVAIAASLFIVFGLQINNRSSQRNVLNNEQVIANLIKENQRLVSELNVLEGKENNRHENKFLLEMELTHIDIELQKLYLDSGNDDDKIKLWKHRQEVIKRLMATNDHSHVIRI
ncbi:MAG: hypothetical protein COB38_05850 [Gammaproteobacteria bacterium]|nr:MAG: hypothetical protein COB38_05850 [Gammaproteobacteria bacterium]